MRRAFPLHSLDWTQSNPLEWARGRRLMRQIAAAGKRTRMTSYSAPDRAVPKGPRVVLASSSPRRRELISELCLDVEVLSPSGYEGPPSPGEAPEDYTLRMAADKAEQAAALRAGAVVIGADTCVVYRGDILGKPVDASEAVATLRRLRGEEHSVVTGLCVRAAGPAGTAASDSLSMAVRRTRVWMRDYSDEEIDAYVASGSPFDKAGSYAIQDTDFDPVDRIQGCYFNVVGFPLCALVETLAAQGVDAEVRRPERVGELCDGCELTGGGA